jgi:hypothetical protein
MIRQMLIASGTGLDEEDVVSKDSKVIDGKTVSVRICHPPSCMSCNAGFVMI